MRKLVLVIFTGICAAITITCYGATDSPQCDRRCLEGFVNQYLAALVAHDPSKAPFAKQVKFTENARELPMAGARTGLWADITTLGSYKFYIADPESGQAAFVGLVREHNASSHKRGDAPGDPPALLSMRLKVENKQITEVESIVVRNMNRRNLWTLTTPPRAFSEPLAPEQRVSRAQLIRISNLYFDGIEQLNGGIVPWHPECYRLENGMWTAGPVLPAEIAAHMPDPSKITPGPGGPPAEFERKSCAAGFDSGMLAVIENIRPRRTPVVDVERGVTWGVYMFNHKGVKTITLPDGRTVKAPYFAGMPNSMPMSELFKIKGGRIRDIMAIGVINAYKSGSGWE